MKKLHILSFVFLMTIISLSWMLLPVESTDISYDAADTANLVAGQPARADRMLSLFTTISTFLNGTEWVETDKIEDGAATGVKINSAAAGDGLKKDSSSNFAVNLLTTGALYITSDLIGVSTDTTSIEVDANNELSVVAAGITETELGLTSVATANIQNNAVNPDKLASDSVITAKILDLNVTTGKLAADAVTTSKIGAFFSGTAGTSEDTVYGDSDSGIRYCYLVQAISGAGGYDFSSDANITWSGTDYTNLYLYQGFYWASGDSTQYAASVVSVFLNPLSGYGYVAINRYDDNTAVYGNMYVLVVGIKK